MDLGIVFTKLCIDKMFLNKYVLFIDEVLA